MEDSLKFETICTLAHLCDSEVEFLETIKRLRKFTPEQIKQHIELYRQVKDNPLGHLKDYLDKESKKGLVSTTQRSSPLKTKVEVMFGVDSNREDTNA